MSYMTNYSEWLSSMALNAEERKELRSILADNAEIESRFFAPLSFGTAGLRGILGMGINRMNRFTVGQATQGLANLIISNGKKAMDKGVAIAYDCRHRSQEFAQHAASILAANGIKVFLFDELRPTPELSLAIRHYGTIAGINITASHNPREYNGFKVYWEDGAQMPPAEADTVAQEMRKINVFTDVSTGVFESFRKHGMIKMLGKETDELFMDEVLKMSVRPDSVKKVANQFKLVYTPFHGAGYRLVPEVLKRLGFQDVLCVPEQMKIDGDFPTVDSPNPENKESFALAIALAKQNDVDLIIGTDPDADRTGIVVKNKAGEYITLSGNQIGVLLIDYIIRSRMEKKMMPENPAVLKSIVTTEMARCICEKHKVTCVDTFTGFKFMAEKIKEFEKTGSNHYIFAYEESYGYLCGDYARDKDAVTASMLIAEMAAYYSEKGMTLFEALEELYKTYGAYGEHTISIVMPGVAGLQNMQTLMTNLRKNPPQEIGGFKVSAVRDYLSGTRQQDGKTTQMELRDSNVLYFELEGETSFIVRPSGTEPKVKIYIMTKAKDRKATAKNIEVLSAAAQELIQ